MLRLSVLYLGVSTSPHRLLSVHIIDPTSRTAKPYLDPPDVVDARIGGPCPRVLIGSRSEPRTDVGHL